MSAARYSGTGAQAASANSARSPAANACRNFIGSSEMAGRRRIPMLPTDLPWPQPFGRAPYVVNTTEAVLFRGGGKIFASNGAGPVADNELAISKGAQMFLRPFPFSPSPHAEGR